MATVRRGLGPVLGEAVAGLVLIGVGGAVLGTGRALPGLLVALAVLVGGLAWALTASSTAQADAGGGRGDDRRSADLTWLIGGGAVGTVIVVAGSMTTDTATVAMLVPALLLGAGILWTVAATLPGREAPATVTPLASVGPPVIMPGGSDAVDAPTVIVQPEVPEDESVSEAVRLEAARSFDLGAFVVHELPDRIQCSNCGRYTDLIRSGERDVTCRVCGTTRSLAEVQPDTRVRMYLDDGAAGSARRTPPEQAPEPKPDADAPTIAPAGATRFAPPTSQGG